MSWQGTSWAAQRRCGSSTTKLVLMCLGNCASPEGVIFARQSTLERDTELEDKAVRRNLKRLMQLGFIRIFERRTPDGRRNSNVIVLMLDCQWSNRAQSPVGCKEYFAGHIVVEKSTDDQQKVFMQQSLDNNRTLGPVDEAATGPSGPDKGTESPVDAAEGEAAKSPEMQQNDGHRALEPGGLKVPQREEKFTNTGAREAALQEGRAVERPNTLKAWYEGHRHLLIEAVGEAAYRSWLQQLVAAADDGTTAQFWAPTRFLADQVRRHYGHVLERVLQRQTVAVQFDVRASIGAKRAQKRERYSGEVRLASGAVEPVRK